MAQSTIVCKNCGAETTHGDAYMFDRDVECEGEDGDPGLRHDHDWSDDDPLARLEARVLASDEMMRVDSEDNDSWQWIEVGLNDGTGFDPVGASEGLSNWVSEEGFAFLGLGDGDNVVRFNRQK